MVDFLENFNKFVVIKAEWTTILFGGEGSLTQLKNMGFIGPIVEGTCHCLPYFSCCGEPEKSLHQCRAYRVNQPAFDSVVLGYPCFEPWVCRVGSRCGSCEVPSLVSGTNPHLHELIPKGEVRFIQYDARGEWGIVLVDKDLCCRWGCRFLSV